jgi:hypothetical protein
MNGEQKLESAAASLPQAAEHALWIKTAKHPDHADYLIGNPHTFRGLILAFCPVSQRQFSLYKEDIDVMSDEASAWVRGFLAGSEPAPPDDQGLSADDWERAVTTWEELTRRYRETGRWP